MFDETLANAFQRGRRRLIARRKLEGRHRGGSPASGRQRAVRRHQRRRRRQAVQTVRGLSRADSGRQRILRLALPRDQRAALDGKPSHRLQEVH